MYEEDDFHNIIPALVIAARAALHLRIAAAAEPTSAALAALAQQILDEAVRFAAAVGEADTFEELAAAYHAHYPALCESFTHLARPPIPAAVQAPYASLRTTWEQTAQNE